jgi:hypothetical protein
MTRSLAAWIFVCAAGCATTRSATERLSAPDPRHGVPATSADADPANTEQRFGFAEAKARKEAKARAERDRRERLGVAGVGGGGASADAGVTASRPTSAGCRATDVPYPCAGAAPAH